MKIGFDLDGVFCTDSDMWIDGIMFKWMPNKWASFRHRFKKLIWKPEGFDYVIITGRPYVDAKITLKWLKKNGVKARVYFAPALNEAILQILVEGEIADVGIMNRNDFFSRAVLHKTKKIIDLKLDLFIESDEKQAKAIAMILNDIEHLEGEQKYEVSDSSVWGTGQHHSVLVRSGVAKV